MAKIIPRYGAKKLFTRNRKIVRTQVEETLLENLSRHFVAIEKEEESIEDVDEPGCSANKDAIRKKFEYLLVEYKKYFPVDCLTDGKLTWDYLYNVIRDADEAAFNAREAANNCKDTLSLVEESVNHCNKRARAVDRTTYVRDWVDRHAISMEYQRAKRLIYENARKAYTPEEVGRLIAEATAVASEHAFQNVEYNISNLTPVFIICLALSTIYSNECAVDAMKAEWLVLKAMKKGWEISDPELSVDPMNPADERNQSTEKWLIIIGIFLFVCIMYFLSGVFNLKVYSLVTINDIGVVLVTLTLLISIEIYQKFLEKWRLDEISRTVIRKNEILAFIYKRIGELNEYFVSNKITPK